MATPSEADFWVKGLERAVKQGWFSSLSAMAYDSRQDRLAVAGGGGHVLLLDLRSLEAIEPRKLEAGIRSLCFADNGHLYAGLENGSVAPITSQGIHSLNARISRKPITALLWSLDYGLIAASKDRHLRRLHPATLEVDALSEKQRWVGHDFAPIAEAQQLVVSGTDNNLHLIDPELLAPLLVLHTSAAPQTHNTEGFGRIATADQDGTVTIIDSSSHTQTCALPIADGALAGVQIATEDPILFFADQNGVVQEWDLEALEPLSALQVEGTTKAMAINASGNVIAVCTTRSVQVFLRASQLSELAWHQQEVARRHSLIGRINQFIRRLLGRPLPALPPAPNLPQALALAALNTEPEIRRIERSTSEALVNAYRQVAAAARRVDWKAVGSAIDKQHRHRLEAQRLELRRLREERLSQALIEAQKRREFRQQELRSREIAIQRARAEKRSKEFWDGVGRLMGNIASTAISSSAAGTWVNSYTRKDGTRVRGYRRR
jgi:hypothetical protein